MGSFHVLNQHFERGNEIGEPVHAVPVDSWWQGGDPRIKYIYIYALSINMTLPDAQYRKSLWLRAKENAIRDRVTDN